MDDSDSEEEFEVNSEPKYENTSESRESVPTSNQRNERRENDDEDDDILSGFGGFSGFRDPFSGFGSFGNNFGSIFNNTRSMFSNFNSNNPNCYSKSSVYTSTNINGVKQETAKMKDSLGNKKVKISRSVGNKKASVLKALESNGTTHEKKELYNLRENDMDEFDRYFNNSLFNMGNVRDMPRAIRRNPHNENENQEEETRSTSNPFLGSNDERFVRNNNYSRNRKKK